MELSIYGVDKMKKIEHNVETGVTTEIELSPSEIKELESEATQVALANAQRLAAYEAQSAEKAALLARLGITDDEAKLLLS